jgi:hydroxypyruvate isomerase
MPKFAANISWLFTELPFMERFAAAKVAGFDAVECLFPYTSDKNEIARALKTYDLKMVLHNLPPGNWEAGDRGIACDPKREIEFQAGLFKAIDYAKTLGCTQLNCLSGKLPEGVSREQGHDMLVQNLRFAAGKLKSAGIRLLIEPINIYDIPDFFLNFTVDASAIIDEVGSDNLFIQYDVYHAQRMEGELASTIKKYLTRIGHIQIADNPGRGEPGTGEINYDFLFRYLDEIGYPGWVSCEYKPRTTTAQSLGWYKQMKKISKDITI